MLTMLRKILSDFEKIKQRRPLDQEFAFLYDSVLHISTLDQSNDSALTNNIQTLLGYYELVARSNQTDVFIQPNTPANNFVLQLALMLSEKYNQPIYSILYARALLWPENMGAWYDPIMGGNELPLNHGEFAITSSGDVCLLECLIDTAIGVFSQGHREPQQIWQNNDPRRLNQPLPKDFIPTLCRSFPAFKQLHDNILSMSTDTPLTRLQALREGLRNGSTQNSTITKEEAKKREYNAGTAANEAIAVFSLWWEDIKHVSYYKQRTLRDVLSTLDMGHINNLNLGEFFAIILRDKSANVSENMEDATTCVHLRGNELQVAIERNIIFLSSFEKPGPGQNELLQYKSNICASFNSYNNKAVALTKSVQRTLIISPEPYQLPYFAYTITQLWHNFLLGNVSETSIIELATLLQQMSTTQRQEFSEKSADFNTKEEELSELRYLFRQLESKLENNILLPAFQKHSLSPVDSALLNILPFNIALLRWVTLRYEFIMFTNRSLCHLVLNKGVEIKIDNKTLTSYDLFSFVSYMHYKTKSSLDRIQKRVQLLRHLLDIDDLSIILDIDTFDTIATNPLTPFCNELLQLAKNASALSPLKTTELLELLAQHQNFLMSALDNDGNTFLHHAFAENNTLIIQWLINLPNWQELSKILHPVKNWTLFDVIAITGHTEQYELLKNTYKRLDWPFAMTLAVKNNNDEFCKLLLNDGGDPNATHGDNDPLLIIAARKGYVTICRLLLKHGAHINAQCNAGYFEGYSALAYAAKRGKGEVCTLLLEHGADYNLKTKQDKIAEELWSGAQNSNPFHCILRERDLEAKRTKIIKNLKLEMPSAFWKHMGFFNNREAYTNLIQQMQQTAFKKTDSPDKTADDVLNETVRTYLTEQHSLDDKTKESLLTCTSPNR